MSAPPGIYVEIRIASSLDKLWRLTQQPALHQRWDLRFTQIEYLPRCSPEEAQHFLYQTRIGFGLAIRGTGESVGTRSLPDRSATSALKFASEDPKSLIREGSGYWRYIPTAASSTAAVDRASPEATSLRFLTWYDYRVRFGPFGRLVDRLFRPVMGWGTAWSFDRLRLWAEQDQSPELSLTLALIHAAARLTVAAIWIWHGLVPKLLFRHSDERQMLADAGVSPRLLPAIGTGELLFGLTLLFPRTPPALLLLSATVMPPATLAVARRSPRFLRAAFNPVTLNLAVAALSLIAFFAGHHAPSARRCLRRPPQDPA